MGSTDKEIKVNGQSFDVETKALPFAPGGTSEVDRGGPRQSDGRTVVVMGWLFVCVWLCVGGELQ